MNSKTHSYFSCLAVQRLGSTSTASVPVAVMVWIGLKRLPQRPLCGPLLSERSDNSGEIGDPCGVPFRCLRDRLVRRLPPSPNLRRVGSRIALFEACSAFTRVPACTVAELLNAALCHRSASAHVVTSMTRSGCYQPKTTIVGWGLHPLRKRAFPRRTEISGLGLTSIKTTVRLGQLRDTKGIRSLLPAPPGVFPSVGHEGPVRLDT